MGMERLAAVVLEFFVALDGGLWRQEVWPTHKTSTVIEVHLNGRGWVENARACYSIGNGIVEVVVGETNTVCKSTCIEVETYSMRRRIVAVLERREVTSTESSDDAVVVIGELVEQPRRVPMQLIIQSPVQFRLAIR